MGVLTKDFGGFVVTGVETQPISNIVPIGTFEASIMFSSVILQGVRFYRAAQALSVLSQPPLLIITAFRPDQVSGLECTSLLEGKVWAASC